MNSVDCGVIASGVPPPALLAPQTEEDAHLPRSGSSAMPDPASAQVPRLKARVHQRLSAAECARIPLSALRFRPLRHSDIDEMKALHTEWFPVTYDEAFYQKSVEGELFSLVASYCPSSSSSATPLQVEYDEELLGMITMSTNCEHHADDIVSVLGKDCEAVCRHLNGVGLDASRLEAGAKDHPRDGEVGASAVGCLAYILTLGVADCYRRKGLARELLRRMVGHIVDKMKDIQAVYLHVVDYNDAAIKLYESQNFDRIQMFENFYLLYGQHYNSYLYARYLRPESMPWKLFMWKKLRSFMRPAESPSGGQSMYWWKWVWRVVRSRLDTRILAGAKDAEEV